jgi:hypothetical protein
MHTCAHNQLQCRGKKALRSVVEHYAERWRSGQGPADAQQQQQLYPPLQMVLHATGSDGNTHTFGPNINKRLKVADVAEGLPLRVQG